MLQAIQFIERVHQTVLSIFSISGTGTFADSLGGWGDVLGLVFFGLLSLLLYKIAMSKEDKI